MVPFTISLLFSGHKKLSFKISAKDDCFKDVSGSNLIVKKGIRIHYFLTVQELILTGIDWIILIV